METKTDTRAAEMRIPSQVVEALRAALGECLVAVVLFGSRARGEANEESDWDMLVIARGLPENYWDRHLFFVHLLPVDLPGSVSLLAKTPEEFEVRIPSLYLDIAIDGKILYDPQHYAEAKLDYIRDRLREAGLYRERTEAGDLWLWAKQPTQPWALEW